DPDKSRARSLHGRPRLRYLSYFPPSGPSFFRGPYAHSTENPAFRLACRERHHRKDRRSIAPRLHSESPGPPRIPCIPGKSPADRRVVHVHFRKASCLELEFLWCRDSPPLQVWHASEPLQVGICRNSARPPAPAVALLHDPQRTFHGARLSWSARTPCGARTSSSSNPPAAFPFPCASGSSPSFLRGRQSFPAHFEPA